MIDNSDLLLKSLREFNIDIDDIKINEFNEYYNMLIEKNKVMNLTSITEYDDVILKHFVDSLAITKVIDMNTVGSLIDVGTGAGFPGIPIKIVYPNVKITLLDSLNKRVKFLDEVIEKLKLKNIDTIHGRAEDFGNDKMYREQYDVCVSRAVANMSTLLEYSVPFVKVNGVFVSYKAGDCEEELLKCNNALKVLGCKCINNNKFLIPNTDISRSLIVIQKDSKLKSKYPRKAGVPAKLPL